MKEAEQSRSGGMEVGTVDALWRHPVKSMLGQELEEAIVTEHGFAGDRAYAVAEAESGQIRSAKRVGWENLFEFRASLIGEPGGEPSCLPFMPPDNPAGR